MVKSAPVQRCPEQRSVEQTIGSHAPATIVIAPGVSHFPGFLDRAAQEALRDEVLAILEFAPPFRPRMPRTGKPFSVLMSNCGALGWVSDERGYGYQATHPRPGFRGRRCPRGSLPPLPIAQGAPPPEACLINLYNSSAGMGLHQDRDEEELVRPRRVLVARRYGAVPGRRASAQRADPLIPPRVRRRDVACRRGPSRVPRRRPHHRRILDPS